jgi:adenylate cyclase
LNLKNSQSFLAGYFSSVGNLVRVGLGLLIVLLFLTHEGSYKYLRFIDQMELLAYDARLRMFLPNTLDSRIVILDIDERSLAAEGRWPWDRKKLAGLVSTLFERYQIKVLGWDVVFAEPDNSSGLASLEELGKTTFKDSPEYQKFLEGARKTLDYDALFADTIGKYPVVLGMFVSTGKLLKVGALPQPLLTDTASTLGKETLFAPQYDGYSGNLKQIQDAAAATGHLVPLQDIDGVTRRVPMLIKLEGGYYEAMSLAVSRLALGNVPVAMVPSDTRVDGQLTLERIEIGGHKIPLDQYAAALVPYRGASKVFRYISMTDVVRGTLSPDELRDKIVIVGTSAQGLRDLRNTPVYEDFSGVEIHANLVSGILDQRIMYKPIYAATYSLMIILGLGLMFSFVLPLLNPLRSTAFVALALILVTAFNLYEWKYNNFVLSLAAPVLMVLLLYFLNMAYGFFSEARSRRLITGLFGTYVPKELVAEMSKNPGVYSMKGESREMTVLFSDVRDFTSISEGLSPEALKELMNFYLTTMTQSIQQRLGTIDKYIGDAIMAFWGAPLADADHVKNGVFTALEMQKTIRSTGPEYVKRGWPVLHIGVGLNCGVMNVGDMGSKFRRAYTVMGDAVNLASRLEALTKEYGVGVLVTENVVKAAPAFIYREVDHVRVKGKLEAVAIFEPIGLQGEVVNAAVEDVERFHKAVEFYRKQRWDDAERLVKSLQYSNPEFKLYKLYLERIAYFRTHPPGTNWDGVFVFTHK